jgi:hypothetical protein
MGCASSSPQGGATEMEYHENYRCVYFDSYGKLIKYNPALGISHAKQLKFIQENDKNPIKPGDECYIISLVWLQDWSACVFSDSTNNVGPIANDSLISTTDKCTMKMRMKLKKDFRTVNKKIWEFLFECYGGGPVIYFTGTLCTLTL